MISKKEYKKISIKWKGKVYQKYKKLKKRLPMIEENIEFFKNQKVLELGSNAGVYALCLYPYIASYIGIESDVHYYEQSVYTLIGKDVMLLNDSFEKTNLDGLDYDLFIASYVLHHLSSFEVNKLNIVFEKCKKIMIHTRSGDPLSYGHDEVGFDPLPRWKNSDIKKMLDSYGYKSEFSIKSKIDYNGIYLILAEKK